MMPTEKYSVLRINRKRKRALSVGALIIPTIAVLLSPFFLVSQVSPIHLICASGIAFFLIVFTRKFKSLVLYQVALIFDEEGIFAMNCWKPQRILYRDIKLISFGQRYMRMDLTQSTNSVWDHLLSIIFGGNNRRDHFFIEQADIHLDFAEVLREVSSFEKFNQIRFANTCLSEKRTRFGGGSDNAC